MTASAATDIVAERPWPLWLGWVKQPRVVRIALWFAYVALALGGYSAIVVPVASLEGAIGPFLGQTQAWLILVGGILGAASILQGWWWMERAGIAFLGPGLVIYGYVSVHLQLTDNTAVFADGLVVNRWMSAAITAAACVYCVVRWMNIRGLDLEIRE